MLRLADQAAGLRNKGGNRGGRVVQLHRAAKAGTRTIAVTSGKGGVGKTTVSANLAIALASSGRSVLLLDADLGLASLDLALGVAPEQDLRSVLDGQKTVEQIIVDGPGGVKLIPACPGRYDMANLSQRERTVLTQAVSEAATAFDVLIIDTGAGIGSNAVSFASGADDVLLVTTPDPTALRDAYAMAKVLNRRSGVDRVQLVSNQVSSEHEGAELHEQLRRIAKQFLSLELSYLGCLLRDSSVREGVVAGSPFMLSAPESIAARCMRGLARRLTGEPPRIGAM